MTDISDRGQTQDFKVISNYISGVFSITENSYVADQLLKQNKNAKSSTKLKLLNAVEKTGDSKNLK